MTSARAEIPRDRLLSAARRGGRSTRGLLAKAIARRAALIESAETDALRIAHEDADGVDGYSIDLYGPFAVLSAYEERARLGEREVADALLELGVAGVYVKRRPRHASVLGAAGEDIAPKEPIAGTAAPPELCIVEHGRKQWIRLGDGLSTGLFLDLRDARSWVQRAARGARFLNLFAYTGAYTVAAGRGGATSSATVDSSKQVLARAEQNLTLNELGPPLPHRTYAEDAQSFLARAKVRGDKWDLAALDPPSFATTKRARFSVEEDYVAVAAATLAVLSNGGTLIASTNHRGIDPKQFVGFVKGAATRASVRLRSCESVALPIDFPPLATGPHLKVVRASIARD